MTTNRTLTDRLNRLIDDKLDDPSFSIDTICQEVGVSRSQLHRVLKEQTQLSVSLYIRQRRLLRAKDLLLSTTLRISEIGDAVGINNPQNFSTYFTEAFGGSPTEFRKAQARLPLTVERPTTPALVSPADEAAAPHQPTQPPHRRKRRWHWLVGIGLALPIAGVGLYNRLQPTAPPASQSLAVLPFTNLSTSDADPICDGILDDVHTSVSIIKRLKVTARSSSDQYKNTKKSIGQIGDELGVANVLKGSVLKANGQLQVKVELINAEANDRVWVHTYRAADTDLFLLTDQLVRDVAGQLKLTLYASTAERLAQARPQHPAAYTAFLQGRQLIVSRTKGNLLEGLIRFNRALLFDSTFAEAHACKAAAYLLLPSSDQAELAKNYRLAEQSALTAIRLDPTSSTAYGVLGSLYHATYQWRAAENAFRIALQHNPNDAQINYWYSLLLRSVGRPGEAVEFSTQAVALDPLHPILMGGHVVNCVYADRLDLAKAGLESGRGLFDNSFSFQHATAYYAIARAEYGLAVAHIEQAHCLNPDDKGHLPLLYYCEAKRGNRGYALNYLRHLTATTPRADYERAVVYAGLNQTERSLIYLKKAADGGYIYRDIVGFPVFKPYHAHPTFKAILRQYKLTGAS